MFKVIEGKVFLNQLKSKKIKNILKKIISKKERPKSEILDSYYLNGDILIEKLDKLKML